MPARAIVAEAIGTALLLAAVVGSGIMGERLAGGNVAIALLANTLATGATLVVGGTGRPEGVSKGFFARPTVFADVRNDMTIAREEIFGPVLCILPYESEEDAVRIANDSPYGLAAFVTSGDVERARRVAKKIRAGNVHINGARVDFAGSFGGYKQSGNGREWGEAGLEEFLELKSVFGYAAAAK